MDFCTLAQARYSCRKFSDKPVEKEKIEKILASGLAAPTAVNRQPYRIWVISSEEGLEKISAVTRYTFGAKIFLAVGYRPEEAWVRPFDKRNFADVDASIAATHLMMAIHDTGLASTWVGYFDAPRLKQLFPQMAPWELIALFPVGYPAQDAAPSPSHKQKRPWEEMVEYL